MHRILLREVVIDAPSATFAATRAFWSAALLAESEPVNGFEEFATLRDPAALSWVGLQDIGPDEPRYHLDIETDDVDAEVARLIGLGAEFVAEGRSWVVLRDPSGHLFDVVACESPHFDERARPVPADENPG